MYSKVSFTNDPSSHEMGQELWAWENLMYHCADEKY
jgi:hypothetical protein